MMQIDQYAVVGNPIAHSKSPLIHSLFAEQTGQQLQYSAKKVEPEYFAEAVAEFFQQGGKGLNITIPFKEQAWQISQHRSALAQKAGAVNTLYLNDKATLCGANTDGIGLVRDIKQNYNLSIKDKNLLILGAGGAVRGVLEPIIHEGPASLTIANRTFDKAEKLATLFEDQFNVQVKPLTDLTANYDMLINGTSSSLSGKTLSLPASILNSQSVCYDMMYSENDTSFMQWAKSNGAGYVMDGLGMLIEQAAESFYIWRGTRPNTKRVIAQLRAA